MGKIILASSSPRRIQIMKDLGVKFEAMDSRIKEEIDIEHSPYEWVKVLSSKKAHAVVENVEGPAIIIAADTVIADLGRILTKPDSRETASKMLRQLQGRHHTVYTGTTFLFIDESGEITEENFVEGTEVTFNKMSIDEINAYLDTFEY
ncbi:MAG: Maf family protein, partial [Anaerotignaceae bacterium]